MADAQSCLIYLKLVIDQTFLIKEKRNSVHGLRGVVDVPGKKMGHSEIPLLRFLSMTHVAKLTESINK